MSLFQRDLVICNLCKKPIRLTEGVQKHIKNEKFLDSHLFETVIARGRDNEILHTVVYRGNPMFFHNSCFDIVGKHTDKNANLVKTKTDGSKSIFFESADGIAKRYWNFIKYYDDKKINYIEEREKKIKKVLKG